MIHEADRLEAQMLCVTCKPHANICLSCLLPAGGGITSACFINITQKFLVL